MRVFHGSYTAVNEIDLNKGRNNLDFGRGFFTIILIISALNIYSYGQEIKPKQNSNNKWGYIDEKGKEVIPFKYDDAKNFSEGLAAIKHNGKWGFIDNRGLEIISCKYDITTPFFEGLAQVKLNDKYGCIDKTGKTVVPIKYTITEIRDIRREIQESNKFSNFAKRYVEDGIAEWQKKGEFEKTIDWQQRVNETTRNEKSKQLLQEAEKAFIAKNTSSTSDKMTLGEYDADNEVFLVKSSLSGNLLVPVPYGEAQSFKTNWNNLTKTPKYFIENDKLGLAEMTFSTTNGKTYKYSNQASLNYSVANINYNFDPINLDIAATSTVPKGNQNISTVNLNTGKSDVDINIPNSSLKNDKTFAVIIANENYQEAGVSQVEFAINDGAIFKEYCIKTLGLPEQNVNYRKNATLNNMRAEINWLRQVAEKYNGEANIIFYYAGHGIPDDNSKTSYLLPTDGFGSDITTAYKLDDLYQTLGNMPAKSVTVFMDACFSGAGRDGKMIAQARGVAVKAKQGVPVGNTVVFSSSQGDETSFPYKEKGHGLFTYFLLKKLQETKGNVTLGELSNYITTQVGQQSVVVNRKSQTPTVIPAATLGDKWQGMKLKN